MNDIENTCKWRTEKVILQTSLAPRSTVMAALDHRPPFTLPGWFTSEIRERSYEVIILENEFLVVTLLPELGFHMHQMYLKGTGLDLFLVNETIQSVPVSKGFVCLPGGLQFDTLKDASSSLLPSAWRVNTDVPGEVTAWMNGTDRMNSLHWAVGFRLRRGWRALQTEVRIHNTGTNVQACWPVWRATMPWSESLRPVPVGAPPPETTGFRDGIATQFGDLMEGSSRTLKSSSPVRRTWFGVYDEERDAGVIHVSGSKRASAAWMGDPNSLAPPAFENGRPAAQNYIPFEVGLETGLDVQPGERVSWKDTWVPFAGMGCPCAVDSPVVVSLSLPRKPSSTGGQPVDSIPFDFSDPDLHEKAAEADDWMISITAWKETAPVYMALEQNGLTIWSDRLALSPGQVERAALSLSREQDHSLSLLLGRSEIDTNTKHSESAGHSKPDMLSFPIEMGRPPAHLQRLVEVHESRAASGLREAINPMDIAVMFGSVLALYHFGLQSLETGQHEAAQAWFWRAAECPPSLEIPCSVRDGAALNAALDALPSHGSPNYYRGLWELAHDGPLWARPFLERAFECGPPWSEFPPLLLALAQCLSHSSLSGSETSPDSMADNLRAATLLDRAIAAGPEDVDLLLERDRLSELMLENAAARLARLAAAPSSAHSTSDIALLMAHLYLQVGDFDQAIEILEFLATAGGVQEALSLRRDALLGRALRLMVQWEMEPALEDIERALEGPAPFSTGGKPAIPQAELLWWAGLCCYRMGRSYHAQGYWQGAAAARAPGASIHAVCKALATGALGGTAQSQGMLEAIVDTTTGSEEFTDPAPASHHFPTELDARETSPSKSALARALALHALGETRAAQMRLEILMTESPNDLRLDWYRQVAAAGLLNRI